MNINLDVSAIIKIQPTIGRAVIISIKTKLLKTLKFGFDKNKLMSLCLIN